MSIVDNDTNLVSSPFIIYNNNISIIGVNQPIIKTTSNHQNGSHQLNGQDTVMIIGDNVTLTGLTIYPMKYTNIDGFNKSVEVIGDVDFTANDCIFKSCTGETYGGALYINGDGTDGTNNININNNTFDGASVCFDGVVAGNLSVNDNTWQSIDHYAIGNSYWGSEERKEENYSNVNISGNSFNNVENNTTIIKARLNQTFNFDATNKVNGSLIDEAPFAPHVNYFNLDRFIICKENKVFVNGTLITNPYLDIDYYVSNSQLLIDTINMANNDEIIYVADGIYELNSQLVYK